MGTIGVQYLHHMGAIWVPSMYLEIVTVGFYLRVQHICIYFYSDRILPIWDPYGSYMIKKPIWGPYSTRIV